jgi:pyruvate/2-oxoglutarate/acetoin dehydrogenase E1 component
MKYAESLNLALHEIMKKCPRAFIIGEDIADPYGGAFKVTKGLTSKYPKRTLSTPISEAAITGLAIGMSLNGMKPILEVMFADFLTLCTDQITNSASKLKDMYGKNIDVPLLIRTASGAGVGYGATHSQSMESLFLSIPNVDIFVPSAFHDSGKCLKEVYENMNKLSLFLEMKALYSLSLENQRLSDLMYKDLDNNLIEISTDESEFDVTFISYGRMSLECQKAMVHLRDEEGLRTNTIVPLQINPINMKEVLKNSNLAKRIVIVEEGYSRFGWASEILSQLYEDKLVCSTTKIKRIGAKSSSIPNGLMKESEVIPTYQDIITSVEKLILNTQD